VPANIRAYEERMSARPHHVGSPYDKDNAEWMLARFKEWGWDGQIERFDVLFPTPKTRLLEMVTPTRLVATLEEPAVAVDPTSAQKTEQLPTYNAYSINQCQHCDANILDTSAAAAIISPVPRQARHIRAATAVSVSGRSVNLARQTRLP
jgi:hypothetical protein